MKTRIIHTLALLSSAFLNHDGSATLPDGSTITPDGAPQNDANFGSDDLMGLGDDDFGGNLADDEIAAIAEAVDAGVGVGFGATRGEAARRRVTNRLKRVQARGRRHDERVDDLEAKLRGKLGGGSSKPKVVGLLGASTSVTAAGAYTVTITTEQPFVADEIFVDGPNGTYLTSVMFGESPVMPAGTNEVAITVLGPTAQGRGLVSDKRLGVGQRLVLTFSTTATSGKINVSLTGDKSPSC